MATAAPLILSEDGGSSGSHGQSAATGYRGHTHSHPHLTDINIGSQGSFFSLCLLGEVMGGGKSNKSKGDVNVMKVKERSHGVMYTQSVW